MENKQITEWAIQIVNDHLETMTTDELKQAYFDLAVDAERERLLSIKEK